MVELARAKAAAANVPAAFEVGDVLQRWLQLLKSDGRLVLIEGHWWTGGRGVLRKRREAAFTRLDDPTLWRPYPG